MHINGLARKQCARVGIVTMSKRINIQTQATLAPRCCFYRTRSEHLSD